MNDVKKEILTLQVELEDMEDSDELLARRIAIESFLKRNERGIFLYLFRRYRFILALVRNGEIDLMKMQQILDSIDSESNPEISNMDKYYLDRLSISEKKFLSNYSTICQDFDIQLGLNLNEDRKPPLQLMIEVKALVDLGPKVLINGRQINIQKNHYYFIPRQEAESYISRGEMIEISVQK